MKIISVVGARPNFMKIAPVIEALNNYNRRTANKQQPITSILVHTGQHYDEKMSIFFFDDLEIPKPDIDLEVGSGTHAEQTAEIMKRFEPILLKEKPDYILVVGDVNSTIACALTASKLGIKIIHVEAGLRSFDRGMPEEINRVLTDALSDILFITEKSAEENLLREGIPKQKIFFVGNVMIDTLLSHMEKAKRSDILFRLDLINSKTGTKNSKVSPYAVLTLHRPSNVDRKGQFKNIMEALSVIGKELPIIFPVHPRTRERINDFGLKYFFSSGPGDKIKGTGIFLIEPLGYLDFLHLMSNSKFVLTDSGGIQEETTVLGIPCITLRENTERPITVTEGTNTVVGTNKELIIKESLNKLNKLSQLNKPSKPPLWDGKAAERIIEIIALSQNEWVI